MTTVEHLLVNSYLSWLKNSVSAKKLDDEVAELTTPFLDRHNDHLQVYAETKGPGNYLLSDDGYIFAELRSSGVESRGSKREELLNQIVSGYGITIRDSELQASATTENLGSRLHSLIQAMLSVDDLFVLSQTNVETIFSQDVARYLDTRDIRYIPSAKFSGKSGLDHMMDFVIPKSRKAPERIVQVVNTPRRDRVGNMLFAINDTRTARGAGTEYYALINDTRRTVSAGIVHAFEEYSVKAQPWSTRDEIIDELAA